ncbi:MAG: hypothetical protein Q4G03_03340 [Planctomycetia bacterium]|nr:hypothetical protein [Planctomycetia bacterium]
MATPNGQRISVGLSEERRISIQRANKQKQELYAQQKKIQFSNLLERSSQDVDDYIESQNNIFLNVNRSRANNNAPNDANASSNEFSAAAASNAPVAAQRETYYSDDDKDGVDFFAAQTNRSAYPRAVSHVSGDGDDVLFDPPEQRSESLQEHLLEQLRLDGQFLTLDDQVRKLCVEIVNNLDSAGFFRVDARQAYEQSVREQRQSGAIAYPEESEEALAAIDEFDAMFDIVSTEQERRKAQMALNDYFSLDNLAKASRRLAREQFDRIVKRKSTKPERERAKRLLDSVIRQPQNSDPFLLLFDHAPTQQERALAEKALQIVQALDPPGVGARDLQESLLLRIKKDIPHYELLRRLVRDHFDDFINKRVNVLAEKTGASSSTVSALYEQSFPFEPSPEQLYGHSSEPMRAIVPEIIVEKSSAGRWTVRLDEAQDSVEIDPVYRKMLLSKRVDKPTKEYLRRQYIEAQALIDALRNRYSTLLRVARAVIDFQTPYLDNLTPYPRPLTQQQIADKLGLDSSTVSRASADKWLATPRGIMPFKNFFPKAVYGDATSHNIAECIRRIVDEEDKAKPLSDEDLSAELKKRFKIDVSRKTVQEHRDRLQIPNSRARKRIASK